jgi:hypothetical protein
MSKDNSAKIPESLSIDAVMSKLQHWRANKSSYPDTGIPDTVWKMIFALEDAGQRPTTLRSLFSLNSGQYAKKHEQLKAAAATKSNQSTSTKAQPKVSEPAKPVAFSEVSVTSPAPLQTEVPSLTQAATNNRQAVKHLRSTDASPEHYLDTTTVIVECIRPDGHRLKIHTTNNRLDIVMQAFFAQEVVTC